MMLIATLPLWLPMMAGLSGWALARSFAPPFAANDNMPLPRVQFSGA